MPSIIKNLYQEILKIGRGIKKLRFFKFKDLSQFLSILGRKEKLLLVGLLAILALDMFSISSRYYFQHTTVTPDFGGSFNEGIIGDPRYINPLLGQSTTDKNLTHLIYSGLYKYQGDQIIPDLASDTPEISPDQKQYTVHLKKNLKWQDGEMLNADDVIFTFETLQNPEYKSPFAKLWKNIKAEKIDDLTIKFTNKDISSPILSNFNLGILPKHIWSNISAGDFYFSKYNLEPIGSGPYAVKEISKSVSGNTKSISLASFSDYSPKPSYINTITLKFYADYEQLISGLHTKEVDAIGFIPFNQKIYVDKEKTNLSIKEIPINQYQGLFFNLKKSDKILGDHAVRQALAQSIDRDRFINEVYSGMAKPAYSPILEGQLGFNPTAKDKISFDLNAANTILDNAGWKKGADGMRIKSKTALKFTITTNDFVLNQKSAENLRDQWKQIGVDVGLNIIPTADLEKDAIHSRNFEALLFSESTGFDPDPFIFWHSSQSNDPGLNLAAYKNNTIDMLISDARNTFDLNARADKYSQFQDIFTADLPAIILDQSVYVYQMQPKIKGVDVDSLANPEDRFYDITNWYIDTKRVWK